MTKRLIAIAWLLESDWPRWAAIDPDLSRYDKWLAKITRSITEFERSGVVAKKVTVDPDLFSDWSRPNGMQVHPTTRAAYAAARLMAQTEAN